jgi:hypothetical protein
MFHRGSKGGNYYEEVVDSDTAERRKTPPLPGIQMIFRQEKR